MTRPDWARGIVLPAGLAALDAGWLSAWAALIGQWIPSNGGAPLLSAPSVFLLLLAGRAATRAALTRSWPLAWVRGGLVALGLIGAILALFLDYGVGGAPADPAGPAGLGAVFSQPLTLTGPVLAGVFGLGLWWRGLRQGRESLSYEEVEGTFRPGVAALIVCLLLAGAAGAGSAGPLQSRLGGAVVVFFGAGLITLSLARLEAIRATSRVAADRTGSFNRDWLAILLGVVAALVLLALLLARIVAFDPLVAVLKPLLDLFGFLIWLLVVAIALPIGLLLEFVIFLTRLALRPGELPPPPEMPDLSDLEQLQREGGPVGLPAPLGIAVTWIVVGLIAGLALFLLARAVSTRRDRGGDEAAVEERESVWTPGLLREELLAWLRNLLHRLFGRFRRSTLAGPAASAVPLDLSVSSPALSIREVYRRLLQLGADRGSPRHRSTTPFEHLPRLQESLPSPDELASITDAYVRARYGPQPPGPADVDEVRRSWERVVASLSAPVHDPD